MPTIEFILRSKFDATGANQALQKLKELTKIDSPIGVSAGEYERIFDMFGGAGLYNIREMQSALEGLSTQLRQLATIAVANQDVFSAIQFAKKAKEVDAYARTLSSVSKESEKATVATQKLAEQTNRLLNQLSARNLKASLGEFDAAMREISSMRPAQQNASFEQGILGGLDARGIQGADQAVQQLRQMATEADRLSNEAFDAGMISRALRFKEEGQQIEGLMRRISGTTQQSGNSFANFGTDALSALNKAGFGLFLITSNLRTLQIVAEGAFNALLEGATKLDVFNAYSRMTKEAGISTARLTDQLNDASQGLITVQTAQAGVNRAILAGVPELAEAAPRLLKMAVAAATVTGNLQDVERIYSTLITGILRGSPRLIDNADIYVQLGDSNERYAESIGKTVEELTEYDQKIATLNAVLEQEADFLNRAGEAGKSAAGDLIQLRTAAEETTGAIKTMLASVAAQDLSILEALIQGPQDAQSDWNLLNEGIVNVGQSLIYLSTIASLPFLAIREGTEDVVPMLEGLAGAMMGLVKADPTMLVSSVEALKLSFSEMLNTSTLVDDAMASARQRADELALALGTVNQVTGQLAADAPSNIRNAFLGPLDEIIASLQYIGSEEYELTKDLADNWEDYRERIEEIEQNFIDRLQEIKEAYYERVADIEEQLAERTQEINEDLAETLEDITEDSQEQRADAEEDYQKDIEKAQEDHQKRLNDIIRRFEMSRLRALIERDARALYEAQRKRDEDLENENESFEDRMEDLEENHQEELERIQEQEDEKRQKAIEEAEKRRQDAQKAYDKAIQDAKDAYEEQQQDAKEAYEKARNDAKKAAKDRENDLKESYAERAYIAEAGEKLRLAIEARAQLESEQNMFDFFLNLKNQVKDYYDFLEEYEDYDFPFAPSPDEVPELPGGNSPSGGSGNNPPGAQSPCASGEGGTVSCNTPNQLYTCSDGSKYVCIGGKWRRTYGGASNSPTGNTDTSFAGGNAGISGGTSRNVTITVRGDKTLEEIFKSIAYDAVVDVMS